MHNALLDNAPPSISGTPTFTDTGGAITDEVLCAALDLVVWCESGADSDDDGVQIAARRSATQSSLQQVKLMLRRYAESMQPCSLETMQEAFYRLTNSIRYRQSWDSINAVRGALDRNWDGIGPWQS